MFSNLIKSNGKIFSKCRDSTYLPSIHLPLAKQPFLSPCILREIIQGVACSLISPTRREPAPGWIWYSGKHSREPERDHVLDDILGLPNLPNSEVHLDMDLLAMRSTLTYQILFFFFLKSSSDATDMTNQFFINYEESKKASSETDTMCLLVRILFYTSCKRSFIHI